MTCKKHNWMPATVEMRAKGYKWYCYNAGCRCRRKTDPVEVMRDVAKFARAGEKAAGEDVSTVRYLVNEMNYVPSWGKYHLNVLQADSANLATGTGIGCTFVLTKAQIVELRKFNGLPAGHNLFGVPVLAKLSAPRKGGNVLGSSTYLGPVH